MREIFDPDGYRAEQKLDLPALTITITACEQDEESGEITVKYIYGDLETEGSVVLPTRPDWKWIIYGDGEGSSYRRAAPFY